MFRKSALLFGLLIVFFAVVVLYGKTLGFEFVYDDHVQITGNPWINGLSNLREVFVSDAWGFAKDVAPSHYYRPMMHLTFMVIFALVGQEPWGFHFWNVLIHALNAGLVFILALRLFHNINLSATLNKKELKVSSLPTAARHTTLGGKIGFAFDPRLFAALFAALIFALHPINAEPVSWVSSVGELYFTMGFLLISIIELTGRPSLRKSCIGGSLFLLALLSKETAIVLPLILTAIRWVTGKKVFNQPILYLPYLAAVVLYFSLRQLAVSGGIGINLSMIDFPRELANALHNFAFYLWKLVWPTGLTVIYDKNQIQGLLDFKVILAILLILCVSGVCYHSRNHRLIPFSWAWIIAPLTIAVFSSVVTPGGFADRYLYCASVGFGLLIAYGFYRLWKSQVASLRLAGAIVISIYIVFLGGASFARIEVWRNDITLFSDAVVKTPQSGEVHNNLGNAYLLRGDYAKAFTEYEKTIQINPRHPQALYNLGLCCSHLGRMDKAIEYYRAFLQYASPTFNVHKERLVEQFPFLKTLKN